MPFAKVDTIRLPDSKNHEMCIRDSPSYDRYIKTAAQGITKASKAFMLDAVIDEDAERLTKDLYLIHI